MLLLVLLLALNFGVSWLNCWSCGRAWVEANALGGLPKLLVWSGAIMAAIGFSSVLLVPLAFLANAVVPQYFGDEYLKGTFALWYVLVIIPAVGTGLIITVQSWIAFFRDRSLLNGGTAVYNTVVQLHNTWSMVNNFGSAFGEVSKLFSKGLKSASESDDPKGALALIGLLIMVAIVAVAIGGGIVLTKALIHRYSATVPLPDVYADARLSRA